MDVQKLATYGTAVAVVGTGSIVGGGNIIDQQTGGPQKRAREEATELRQIIREEVRSAILESWPKTTGHIKGLQPNGNYREIVPKNGSNK
tara:strand:+ start:358 stop:627 length:270 start_codon:yes stop_codon:yes gene_type:complete